MAFLKDGFIPRLRIWEVACVLDRLARLLASLEKPQASVASYHVSHLRREVVEGGSGIPVFHLEDKLREAVVWAS